MNTVSTSRAIYLRCAKTFTNCVIPRHQIQMARYLSSIFLRITSFLKMVIQCPYGKGKLDLSKKQLSMTEKLWFIQAWKQRGRSLEALCEQYNIPSPRVRKWVELARANGQLNSGHGRPPFLSPESKERPKEELLARTYRTSFVDFQDMVHRNSLLRRKLRKCLGLLSRRFQEQL